MGASAGAGAGTGMSDGSSGMPPSPAASQSCSTTLSPPPTGAIPSTSDRRMSSGSHHATPPFGANGDAPPPVAHYPPHHDVLFGAVNECLAILDTFKSSDPVQTLLLVPCLVIGCAAFAPAQQERVRAAVRTVRGYTGLRIVTALPRFWRRCGALWLGPSDEGRGIGRAVAKSMGLDFTCA
ncbi:hypothetical protein NUW58_g10539 [Xylaria curta]|uniref:Uncharacterized protein n=1 Tax=Xylaria curta TaxID=42375 RepID=A0ACC1MJZ9_9PEZI|nr:hypothetical protein NUW58_g10539 [Xylaria curta]